MEAVHTERRKERVYISFPVSAELSIRDSIEDLIRIKGDKDVDFWLRGNAYSPEPLITADKVVFYINGNHFKYQRHKLSSGCKKELELAIKYKKEIYLAYRSNLGLRIYAVNVNTDIIEGIPGTYLNFFQEKKYNEMVNPCSEIFKTHQTIKEISMEDVQKYMSKGIKKSIDLRVLLINNKNGK